MIGKLRQYLSLPDDMCSGTSLYTSPFFPDIAIWKTRKMTSGDMITWSDVALAQRLRPLDKHIFPRQSLALHIQKTKAVCNENWIRDAALKCVSTTDWNSKHIKIHFTRSPSLIVVSKLSKKEKDVVYLRQTSG